MSIKYVQSTDNKYVQYRFMLSTFSNSQFVNVPNWQGIDDIPIVNSSNLIKSSGAFSLSCGIKNIESTLNDTTYIDSSYFSRVTNGSGGIRVWIDIVHELYSEHTTFTVTPNSGDYKFSINQRTSSEQEVATTGWVTSEKSAKCVSNGYYVRISIAKTDDTQQITIDEALSYIKSIKIKTDKEFIVNDLTTGGTNMALSAGQGKQLKIYADSEDSKIVNYQKYTCGDLDLTYENRIYRNGQVKSDTTRCEVNLRNNPGANLNIDYTVSSGYSVSVVQLIGLYIDYAIGKNISTSDILVTSGWQTGSGNVEILQNCNTILIQTKKNDDSTISPYDASSNISIKLNSAIDDLKQTSVKASQAHKLIDILNVETIEDESWAVVYADKKKRIIAGIKSDYSIYWGVGVPDIIKNYINQIMSDYKGKSNISNNPRYPLYIGGLISENGSIISDSVVIPYKCATLNLINNISNATVSVVLPAISSMPLLVEELSENNPFTIPEGYFNYQIKITGIGLQSATDAIANGDICIYYDDNDVITCNQPNLNYIKAAIYHRGNTAIDRGDVLPTFVHITDQHLDAIRTERAFVFADYIKANGIFLTGDAVNSYSESSKYQEELAKKHRTKTFFCIGNHEMVGSNITEVDVYNKHMKEIAEHVGYISNSNDTDKTYYYYDLANEKIRIIALNDFENYNGAYTGHVRITQTQINWFISTLLSTPNDYGIIILRHYYELPISAPEGKQQFINEYNTGSGSGYKPIADIIDAFISRTTINETVSQYETSDTLDLQGDFTSVDSSTDFLFYACGHTHRDACGYYTGTTNKQLVLNLTTACALYGHYSPDHSYNYRANDADLARGGEGISQDAMNIYAIDRKNNQIKIARIGANVTYTFAERKYVMLNYKD